VSTCTDLYPDPEIIPANLPAPRAHCSLLTSQYSSKVPLYPLSNLTIHRLRYLVHPQPPPSQHNSPSAHIKLIYRYLTNPLSYQNRICILPEWHNHDQPAQFGWAPATAPAIIERQHHTATSAEQNPLPTVSPVVSCEEE